MAPQLCALERAQHNKQEVKGIRHILDVLNLSSALLLFLQEVEAGHFLFTFSCVARLDSRKIEPGEKSSWRRIMWGYKRLR